MSWFQRSFIRLVAAALLAWMAVGTVAAPLTKCCVGTESCCVATQSGQGCVGCATVPAMAASDAVAPCAVRPEAPEAVAFSRKEFAPFPPWEPPD